MNYEHIFAFLFIFVDLVDPLGKLDGKRLPTQQVRLRERLQCRRVDPRSAAPSTLPW